MNKHYDKLVLLVALCALIAGAVLYVNQAGPQNRKAKSLGDGAYPSVAVPAMELSTVDWTAPLPQQPSGFKYEVFTPFKIYIEPKTGEFTQDRPGPIVVDPCIWDAILVSMIREPYRIQLEGFIDEGEGNVLFLFHDVELRKTVRARNGKESAGATASEFRVTAAEVKLVEGDDGSRTRVATATIVDLRTNEAKTLIHRELLFEDAVTIMVASDKDSSFQAELSAVGDTFTTEHGSYTLQEINLEESTITVEKAATEDCELETKVLAQQAPAANEPSTIEDEITDPSIAPDTAFDLFFQ